MAYSSLSHQQGQLLWSRQVEIANATEQTSDSTLPKEISKTHWKTQEGVENCRNKKCKKKFSLIERVHHCRRCGDIFCNNCVRFRRHLNILAHPDPEGKPYKVCQLCFEEGKDSSGQARRLTDHFLFLRRQGQENAVRRENGKICGSWRNRFNLEKEINRLLVGFKDSIGTSEMKRTLNEMTTILSTPTWQKATFWVQENMAKHCQKCQQEFNLIRNKHNCKVCAKTLCKSCSCKDVIIYLPDEEDTKTPRIAVIKVIGSPTVEPDIALYIRVCDFCLEKLKARQISKAELEDKALNTDSSSLDTLIRIHTLMHKEGLKMENQLNEYQLIIESLEDNSTSANHSRSGRSNIQTVAKAQEDIADYLARYIINIQKMKKLTPETNTQAILYRNCLKSKCDFYFENQFRYKSLKSTIGDTTPPAVLEAIQRTVDKHAIISTQLYIRQLTFEALHICDKYKLMDDIPMQLTKTDEHVERESEECLQCDGEDIESHAEHLQQLLQLQLKDHRLIKISRRLISKSGNRHAADMVIRRSTEVINQVKVQLMMKSANRSFPLTKKSLDQTLEELKSFTLNDIIK